MKKILLFSLLAMIFTIAITEDAHAQRRGKKKKKTSKVDEYFDESGNFLAKVWYGAGFNLNFSSGCINDGFGNCLRTNYFIFGISPMAGYKISEDLSFGPRIEFYYQGNRIQQAVNSDDDYKLNSVNLGIGVFARYKINQTYFVHAEYQSINEELPRDPLIISQGTDIETFRTWTQNYFAGVGYTGGGVVGFEAYLLWNFAQEYSSANIPLSYRFGINYKF